MLLGNKRIWKNNMSKKHKQHQLIGVIKHCWPGTSKSRLYKNQPFYCLEIKQQTLLGERKETVYVFFNLVNQEIWNTLKSATFKDKKYLFYCEKRTRGWRLKEWEEIN